MDLKQILEWVNQSDANRWLTFGLSWAVASMVNSAFKYVTIMIRGYNPNDCDCDEKDDD